MMQMCVVVRDCGNDRTGRMSSCDKECNGDEIAAGVGNVTGIFHLCGGAWTIVYVFVHYLPLSSYLCSNISQPHLIYITLVHVQATTWNPFQGIAKHLTGNNRGPNQKEELASLFRCILMPLQCMNGKLEALSDMFQSKFQRLTGSIYSHLGLNCSHVLLHERGENTTVIKCKGFEVISDITDLSRCLRSYKPSQHLPALSCVNFFFLFSKEGKVIKKWFMFPPKHCDDTLWCLTQVVRECGIQSVCVCLWMTERGNEQRVRVEMKLGIL